MSRLKINNLIFNITTNDGSGYGATISFKKGLNVIYGPNSVGKTSIVTGIVYGLGAEKGLGIFKTIQNPFKPEFYKAIDGKIIKTSYLLLEISNGEEVVTIFRYIKGTDINIVAVKKCKAVDFHKIEESEKLIVSGEGVFSENGFQTFLFDFLGLEQVLLPTYDQNFSKLYFENLLPLFFVEQRAGWSQIQARQVTRYNIKDIKKVAFEYLFGLDRFNLHLIEIKVKELDSHLRSLRTELKQKEENLLIIANAEKVNGIPLVNTNYIGKTSIYEYIKYLKDKYKVESDFINQLSNKNKKYEDSNLKLRDSIKSLDFQYRKSSERISKLNTEISGYENYLDRIKSNKYKNRQLKKIREFSTDLNIKSCPICETKLATVNDDECLLCHNDLSKKISTPEQNLAFLEDEEKTFKKVISQRIIDRRKIIEKRSTIKEKINEYETQLDLQTKTYAGKEFAALRKRILDADSTYKDMQKFTRISERWEKLSPLRKSIVKTEKESNDLKEEISKYKQTSNDSLIIGKIKTYIKSNVSNLGLFKGNKNLIEEIKLDETDNYTPYLDNFDIYNISSSSDNIRIILSYYLALLQTSIELNQIKNISYPNILILDEPKQQNLDNDSLIDCLSLINQISSSDSQVIITTYSELDSDRDKFKEHIIYEMKNKADYLIKPLA